MIKENFLTSKSLAFYIALFENHQYNMYQLASKANTTAAWCYHMIKTFKSN
jgi:hypothetical protein